MTTAPDVCPKLFVALVKLADDPDSVPVNVGLADNAIDPVPVTELESVTPP